MEHKRIARNTRQTDPAPALSKIIVNQATPTTRGKLRIRNRPGQGAIQITFVFGLLLSFGTQAIADEGKSVENLTPGMHASSNIELKTGVSIQDNASIGLAADIPTSEPTTVISVAPVVLSVPGRLLPLQVRVTAPTTGRDLPIILLSHGHGMSNNLASLYGCGPLANFWAAHGFVVIQPTHLSSKVYKFDPKTPGAPLFWRSRAEDMSQIIDRLDAIETAVPEIKGRLDKTRIAVAGVSMGGLTASMLIGAHVTDADDPKGGADVDMSDPRIKVGLLLSAPGRGGADLSPAAAKFAYNLDPDFSKMSKPALIVVGEKDSGGMTIRGSDWHADPYYLSPGPKSLLIIAGGMHLLGGVSGYDAAETKDESPERVATIQRMTWAYLRSTLYPGDTSWAQAYAAFADLKELGTLERKSK